MLKLMEKDMEREFYYSKDGTKIMVVAPIAEMERKIGVMDRFKYRYDHMLVIGNGFDLNLGLPTTYKNFVESRVFKKMYVKRTLDKRDKGISQPSLLDYLYGKKFCERWFDIEQALLEYVSKKPDGSFVNNIEEDIKDYDLICTSLIEYLVSLFKTGNDLEQSRKMEKTIAGQLLKALYSEKDIIYSFNYTPINLIISAVFGHSSLIPTRIHGEIKEETIFNGKVEDNSIILGIETNDINQIAPGYSFLFKSNNPKYKSSNIALDLLDSQNVIIFGHSLNQMDFGYFENYFKLLTMNADKKRKLTIITKDEKSRIAILDRMRIMGISVRDIFAHVKVDFFLTDLLTENGAEFKRYSHFLNELSMTDGRNT